MWLCVCAFSWYSKGNCCTKNAQNGNFTKMNFFFHDQFSRNEQES